MLPEKLKILVKSLKKCDPEKFETLLKLIDRNILNLDSREIHEIVKKKMPFSGTFLNYKRDISKPKWLVDSSSYDGCFDLKIENSQKISITIYDGKLLDGSRTDVRCKFNFKIQIQKCENLLDWIARRLYSFTKTQDIKYENTVHFLKIFEKTKELIEYKDIDIYPEYENIKLSIYIEDENLLKNTIDKLNSAGKQVTFNTNERVLMAENGIIWTDNMVGLARNEGYICCSDLTDSIENQIKIFTELVTLNIDSWWGKCKKEHCKSINGILVHFLPKDIFRHNSEITEIGKEFWDIMTVSEIINNFK